MSKINLTWTLPTTRTDGSALTPTDIAKVSIFDGSTGTLIADLPGSATSYESTTDATPGTYAFNVTVTDTTGNTSAPASTSIVVPTPVVAPPSPVTNLTATLV
jgi:PKD repeat protein